MRSARDAAPCQVLERIGNEGNFRRVTELNQGHVASACSFASMEQVAREQVEAKGVIWERGPHACQFEMEQWVARQQVTRGAFSVEQLFTGSDAGTTLRSPERAKLLSSMSDALLDVRVQAACQKVVAWLPPALRGPMSGDAKALADILLRLCPETTWLTIQVEIVDNLGTCTRWHQDRYTARALITYTGPGTWCVDDASVRRVILAWATSPSTTPYLTSPYLRTPNPRLTLARCVTTSSRRRSTRRCRRATCASCPTSTASTGRTPPP